MTQLPTTLPDARTDRVQLQTAVTRGRQDASQAARERTQADFERALERVQQRDEPGPAKPERPRAAREAVRTAGAGVPDAPRLHGALDAPTATEAAAVAGAQAAQRAPAPATGPDPSARVESPRASEAVNTAATAGTPQALPSVASLPNCAPRPQFTPHELGANLQRLQVPAGEQTPGRWRFELADATLPVQHVELSRSRDGGVQVALQAKARPGGDASLAAPLERLRERLAERGAQVDGVQFDPTEGEGTR